jgi:6-pyruvoyltetrahydropterin/6-carboxytetrahydropterin synthase
MIYLTRRAKFSAAHRLHNPNLSDEENREIYDICNNPYGHGHNYVVEITVAGTPDIKTGYLIDLKVMRKIINEHIISKVDHKHLNHDVDFLKGINPTVENLASVFWEILKDKFPGARLHKIKINETESSYVEYFGGEFEIKRID